MRVQDKKHKFDMKQLGNNILSVVLDRSQLSKVGGTMESNLQCP